MPDAGFVSFMYSYPNLIPLPADEVERIRQALRPVEFDRLYAGWFGKCVRRDAHVAVEKSADRYIGILNGTLGKSYF